MQGTYLKLKDENVLKFNIDTGEIEIINKNKLPYSLKNLGNDKSRNIVSLNYFFNSRIISIDREYADKIIKACLSASPIHKIKEISDINPLRISAACRGLSVNDDYWIVQKNGRIEQNPPLKL